MMTQKKNHDGVHPAEAKPSDLLDQPASTATAAKLVAHLGFTEAEALAIIATTPATPEELAIAAKVDLHAIGLAISDKAVRALSTDAKIDLGLLADGFEERAARIRVNASAEDKLQHAIDDIHGAARLDASVMQEALNIIVPQIRTRARANPAVRTTYSSLLAYQHGRYPGRHGGAATGVGAAPAVEPGAKPG